MSAERNIYQRLHAVMGEVDYIQKERKQGMNYTIVSHDAVTAKVRPILHSHGIVYHPHSLDYVQDGNRTQVSLVVRFVNVDQPSDFVDVPCLGYGIDPQDKGPGKAVSYAVKYALLKALGLETGDDPDEDAATPHHEAGPKPAPVRQQTKQQPASDGVDNRLRAGGNTPDEFGRSVLALIEGAPDDDVIARIGRTNHNGIAKLAKDAPALHRDIMAAITRAETNMKGQAT